MALLLNSNFYIPHNAVSITLQGNSMAAASDKSEYVAVSCVAGTKMAVRDTVRLRATGTDLVVDFDVSLDYRTWYLSGYNTRFSTDYADRDMYVYARVDATGTSALLVFSPNRYDYNGSVIRMVHGDASDLDTFDDDGDAALAKEFEEYMAARAQQKEVTAVTRLWIPVYASSKDEDGQEVVSLQVHTAETAKQFNETLNITDEASDLYAREGDPRKAVWLTDYIYERGENKKGIYRSEVVSSNTYYYMPLGVILAPEDGIRSWGYNMNGSEGIDLGQLGTDLDNKSKDDLFELYNGLIKPLYSFRELDLQGNLLWKGQELSGVITSGKDWFQFVGSVVDSAGHIQYTKGDDKLATAAAVDKNFIAKYQNDSNNDHRLTLGQLMVNGRETTPIEYYEESELWEIDGTVYIKETLGEDEEGNPIVTSESVVAPDNLVKTPESTTNEKDAIAAAPNAYSRMLATFDHLTKEVSGAGVYRDSGGYIHMETDYLTVHNKLTAKEVEISEISYVGGAMVLTPADGFRIEKVEASETKISGTDTPAAYTLYWRAKTPDGVEVHNTWKVGDQALSQSFNLNTEEEGAHNHGGFLGTANAVTSAFWWRLVTAVGQKTFSETGIESIDGVKDSESITYNYITVSNDYRDPLYKATGYRSGSGAIEDFPKEGESVVMLGHQKSGSETNDDAASRQSAIILDSATLKPSIREIIGICSLEAINLDNKSTDKARCAVQIQPGDNRFTGTVTIENFSWDGMGLPEEVQDVLDKYSNLEAQIKKLQGISFNYIRNSVFHGDYLSPQIQGDTVLTATTEMKTDHLVHWTWKNVDTEKAEGLGTDDNAYYYAVLSDGSLIQEMSIIPTTGSAYSFSLYGYVKSGTGSVKVEIGGVSHEFELTTTPGIHVWEGFEPEVNGNTLKITGTGRITKLMLNQGVSAQVHGMSVLDNSDDTEYYHNLHYLMESMMNGKTLTNGGLVLTSHVEVGTWDKNAAGEDTFKPQAGINGLNTFENGATTPSETPAFWAGLGDADDSKGATVGRAVKTAQYYRDYPNILPTDEQAKGHVNALITHDGTAVFNKAFIRGKIRAESGSIGGWVLQEKDGQTILGKESLKGDLEGLEDWNYTSTTMTDGFLLTNKYMVLQRTEPEWGARVNINPGQSNMVRYAVVDVKGVDNRNAGETNGIIGVRSTVHNNKVTYSQDVFDNAYALWTSGNVHITGREGEKIIIGSGTERVEICRPNVEGLRLRTDIVGTTHECTPSNDIIYGGAHNEDTVVTLPKASTCIGKVLYMKNFQANTFTVKAQDGDRIMASDSQQFVKEYNIGFAAAQFISVGGTWTQGEDTGVGLWIHLNCG